MIFLLAVSSSCSLCFKSWMRSEKMGGGEWKTKNEKVTTVTTVAGSQYDWNPLAIFYVEIKKKILLALSVILWIHVEFFFLFINYVKFAALKNHSFVHWSNRLMIFMVLNNDPSPQHGHISNNNIMYQQQNISCRFRNQVYVMGFAHFNGWFSFHEKICMIINMWLWKTYDLKRDLWKF